MSPGWLLLALPSLAMADDGTRLLAQFHCGACHVIPGVPAARGTLGPPLAELGRRNYLAGRVPLSRQALVQWIVDPASLVPGTPMPAMGVTPAQAARMADVLLR